MGNKKLRKAEEHGVRTETQEALFALGQHDPTVGRYIDAWMAGNFTSFEAMLINMILHLQKEKDTTLGMYRALMKRVDLGADKPLIIVPGRNQ